jgi:hypothetical protein
VPKQKFTDLAFVESAEGCEAVIRRGRKELAERLRQEAEKHRMLLAVIEELALASRCPF